MSKPLTKEEIKFYRTKPHVNLLDLITVRGISTIPRLDSSISEIYRSIYLFYKFDKLTLSIRGYPLYPLFINLNK